MSHSHCHFSKQLRVRPGDFQQPEELYEGCGCVLCGDQDSSVLKESASRPLPGGRHVLLVPQAAGTSLLPRHSLLPLLLPHLLELATQR
ncbi:hypothetical protein V5799_004704 [Amblyomma americanum]|uniref:Uncharacterized protein n=1 Tax=Amblyomma americanum TaxID=6943 RepID=A0AAQ4D5C6_AMBAM